MIYVAYCKKCGYGIEYTYKCDRDNALKVTNGCPNCSQLVRLKNGAMIDEDVLDQHNANCALKWQEKLSKKAQNKEKTTKISIITGAILAGLATISGFVISFLEEIKAFLAQASNLIVEIIDIISNFFSSFG